MGAQRVREKERKENLTPLRQDFIGETRGQDQTKRPSPR